MAILPWNIVVQTLDRATDRYSSDSLFVKLWNISKKTYRKEFFFQAVAI